ncbi:unnamed protein product, partial [Coregonus sp. 'balchen']
EPRQNPGGMRGNSIHTTSKGINNDVCKEIHYPVGKIEQLLSNGWRVITFRNGTRKEINADQNSQKEYPDGTVKTVYSNERQETMFPSGRVRIKDKDGLIIIDKK